MEEVYEVSWYLANTRFFPRLNYRSTEVDLTVLAMPVHGCWDQT